MPAVDDEQFDQELDVRVDNRFRFEWRDLSDEADVLSDAVGPCVAVLRATRGSGGHGDVEGFMW
ncbi:hypothetical protein [Modestobacter sp. I12A-02662]|uniref:hypothetical protein n=1 Tax=Modestobacter sp. I12A-02662 TaxID=1730496 RepID=UPI0034DE1821